MVTTYWLTFRLSARSVNYITYDDRRQALLAAVERHSTDRWEEPTSFLAFRSGSTIEAISKACKLAIAPSWDMFLIREMDRQNARIGGLVLDRKIFQMMPYLKAV